MKKNLKKIVSLVLVLAMSLAISVPAFAQESTDGAKIKLGDLYVTTKYNEKNITIERKESVKEIRVTIKDKNSGTVLETFGEEKSKTDEIQPWLTGTYSKRIYHETKTGPATSRLYSVLEIYQYDSFVQINKVKQMYWSKVSSGNWTLEDTYTDSSMNSTPSLSVDLSGTATVTVTTTSNTTGSFSISSLEGFGFSVSQSAGSTYYARMPIEAAYGYSVA